MKKFIKEFNTFLKQNNVIMLAVGLVIGSSISNITDSFTINILSPILGAYSADGLSRLRIPIANNYIQIGNFIESIISLIITVFILYLMIRLLNGSYKMVSKDKKGALVPNKKVCPYCKSLISASAIKCPNCTSDLIEDNKQKGEDNGRK